MSIRYMPYQSEAALVLDRWRDVERQLAGVRPGSSEVEELQAEVVRLRDEYQRLTAFQGYEGETTPLQEPAGT
jgi:hypothetical protein